MVTGKKGGGANILNNTLFFSPEVTPFLMVTGWYDININIEIFKFEYQDIQIWISQCLNDQSRLWDIQIWKSGYSNLNIPMSQWSISASGYSNLKIGIFKFENRDFQIWI